MKQMTLAVTGFERYSKTTRRAAFLAEMERVVPWAALCGMIEPAYPKSRNGRPPVSVEWMLCIYFLQQWFCLSGLGVEEALYDSLAMHQCAVLYHECRPARRAIPTCIRPGKAIGGISA